jgi:hypothetical protein
VKVQDELFPLAGKAVSQAGLLSFLYIKKLKNYISSLERRQIGTGSRQKGRRIRTPYI